MKKPEINALITTMFLVSLAFIPAASAQEENNYNVPVEKAFEHANVRMVAFIATANDSEKWGGASIDPKPLELYDINGQRLYYEFSVYKKNTMISRIDIGANKTLGSSLRRIEIDPKTFNAAEAMSKSIETAKNNYPTGEIKSTMMVVYNYPEIGAMTVVKDKTTGVEHRIFVDAYTLDVIPDKHATETGPGVWSMYEQVSKNKIDENLKDWQSSEQLTKTLEQQANNMGININLPATEEDIKKLSNKLSASSKVISSPYNSKVISPATDYTSEQRVLYVPLYYQTKAYYCIPATAQMIAAWWGYSYTQDYIYQKMGGTNGNTTGIDPQHALAWYQLSRSNGGLGATRSYLSSDRTIIKAKSELDLGRSFDSLTLYHSRACAGYWVFYNGGQDCLYINDPASSGSQYWEALSGSPEIQRIYVDF